MKSLVLISALPFIAGLCTVAQTSNTSNAQFRLYRGDKSCACIKSKKQTETITASDVKVGNSIYQVFRSRGGQKEELFRIAVGHHGNSDSAKLWNYGIVDEADFNGDGIPDYSWYGGDDTTLEMYLFLSSSSEHGYKRIDLIKTLQSAWKRRFHTAAPKFDELDSDYSIGSLLLTRTPSGLMLVAHIDMNGSNGKGRKKTFLFNIDQQNFKF